MDRLEVTVDEDGHHATYGRPELVAVEISDTGLVLSFDPVHFDTDRLEYDREQLASLAVGV